MRFCVSVYRRGMNQKRYGDSSVHYDETGRVIYSGRRRPDDTLPEPHRHQSQRRDDYRPRDRNREPSYRDNNRAPAMDPYSRGGRPAHNDYPRGGRQHDNGGYRPEQQRYEQVRMLDTEHS